MLDEATIWKFWKHVWSLHLHSAMHLLPWKLFPEQEKLENLLWLGDHCHRKAWNAFQKPLLPKTVCLCKNVPAKFRKGNLCRRTLWYHVTPLLDAMMSVLPTLGHPTSLSKHVPHSPKWMFTSFDISLNIIKKIYCAWQVSLNICCLTNHYNYKRYFTFCCTSDAIYSEYCVSDLLKLFLSATCYSKPIQLHLCSILWLTGWFVCKFSDSLVWAWMPVNNLTPVWNCFRCQGNLQEVPADVTIPSAICDGAILNCFYGIYTNGQTNCYGWSNCLFLAMFCCFIVRNIFNHARKKKNGMFRSRLFGIVSCSVGC